MNIVDYRVVWECDRREEVLSLIKEGWLPLGGVAVRHGSSSGHSLVQAMVRYDNEINEEIE